MFITIGKENKTKNINIEKESPMIDDPISVLTIEVIHILNPSHVRAIQIQNQIIIVYVNVIHSNLLKETIFIFILTMDLIR